MGLIKAAQAATGTVMADQWKEYFYCESMPADVLVTKAHKKVSGTSFPMVLELQWQMVSVC